MLTTTGVENLGSVISAERANEIMIGLDEEDFRKTGITKPRGLSSFIYAPFAGAKEMVGMKSVLEEKLGRGLYYNHWLVINYPKGKRKQSYVAPHFDRKGLDVAVSINIYRSVPWSIMIRGTDGIEQRIIQEVGDGVAYTGRECRKWRYYKPYGSGDYTQLVLYYSYDREFEFDPYYEHGDQMQHYISIIESAS